jgi:hypothetical protein
MTDNSATEKQEGLVDVSAAFVADTQSAELMQPAERTFHNPTGLAQTTTMQRALARQSISDAQTAQPTTVGRTAVSTIALNKVRTSARSSNFAAHRWHPRQQRLQLTAVMHVGRGQLDAERNALGIGEKMMFAARFAAVGRVRPRLEPPKRARTLLESTTARDQSSRSAACNRRNSSRWSLSHTPAFCQSRSRRQHVTPLPHPNSCGKSCQAMPLLSTNKIPVSAARSDTPLRPGNFCRRVFFGSSGAMIAHNESSTSRFAIRSLCHSWSNLYNSF